MGVRVGVDLMGGDQPPLMIFEAVVQVREELHAADRLVVFAKHEVYPELTRKYGALASMDSIEFITTDESIEMDEPPLLAVRRKKKSSMAAGMRLLQEKKIDAFVSMGNTGALVATAMLHLSTFTQIERPALLVTLPNDVAVLDVGANVSAKPEQLFSYAVLGSLYQKIVKKRRYPKVGLLNIGVEEQKGTKELKETYQLLQDHFKERFLGNVEGMEVFQKEIDVLVADGFTGNIFLKTSEGVCRFLLHYLKENFATSGPIVSHLSKKFNYAEHPGAILLGVDGIVIKCHGYSDVLALKNGIRGAIRLARENIVPRIKEMLEKKK